MFQMLQDRLVKELALAGIRVVEAGNEFICDVCLRSQNAWFAVQAEQEGSAFVAMIWGRSERDPLHPGRVSG